MEKEIVIKILKQQQITLEELNKFIVDYIQLKQAKAITPEQIKGIIQFISMGLFDLRFAALQAAESLKINVSTLLDINNNIIQTYCE